MHRLDEGEIGVHCKEGFHWKIDYDILMKHSEGKKEIWRLGGFSLMSLH